MSSNLALNVLNLPPCLVTGLYLTRSARLKIGLWRAMLTPLLSIIGSGFLILAPLLASIVRSLSPGAIMGIRVPCPVVRGPPPVDVSDDVERARRGLSHAALSGCEKMARCS